MVDSGPVQTWQLVTRREAAAILGCSMRTVSRRVADGTLQTVRRPNGQRAIIYASVMALAGMDTPEVDAAQPSAKAWPTEAVQLAVGYATLAQAVRAHLGAGWMARKSTRQQLEAVLNQQAAQLATLEQASGPQIVLEPPTAAPEPTTET